MAAKKFYAVKKGKIPGIYFSWEDCKRVVDGYPGPVYRGFATLEEAEAFIGNSAAAMTKKEAAEGLPENYAFVDGSYNIATKVYGFGGFLFHAGEKEILQGSGSEEEMASMRNVAGEILGSMAAIEKALELGLEELTIYYDYMGIEMWANGGWKRNKVGTIRYYDYIQSIKNKITINFVKVKGHSGVEGNEEADALAKEAAGIQ